MIQRYSAELKKNESEIMTFHQQLHDIQSQQQQIIRSYEVKLEQAHQKLIHDELTSESHQRALEEETKRSVASESKFQAIENEFKALQQSYERQRDENISLTERIAIYEIRDEEFRMIAEDYSNLIKLSHEQEVHLQHLQSEVDRIQEEKYSLSAQLVEYKASIENLDITSCQNCEALEDERSELFKLLAEAKSEILNLQSAIQEIDQKKDQLVHDAQAVLAENQALRSQLASQV
jgi:chromosome segregation ATPase